jgi:hypothetical protein
MYFTVMSPEPMMSPYNYVQNDSNAHFGSARGFCEPQRSRATDKSQ